MISSQKSVYRGRFAPSPTGALHLGSLLTAVGSYLQARQQRGVWLLRMDDADHYRCRQEASASIVADLAALGFHWSEEIRYQRRVLSDYQQALNRLQEQQAVFACACSRKRLAGTRIYDGHCRFGVAEGETARAYRLKVPDRVVCCTDKLHGSVCQNLAHVWGDFVLWRADGVFAYPLTVVVDDGVQGITEVVRGADLLEEMPRQWYLQHLLGYAHPEYLHLPLVFGANGLKLSKQHGAPAIVSAEGTRLLWRVLTLLGQSPPEDLQQDSLSRCWEWAIAHWRIETLPKEIHLS
ncbi:tRNA glutamyl-Q(34) synthetase GluQRS [Thioflexithrix psekupsensis]|uniref:Glutamyl-Q tRNA(Asp) synthetase n=1 Tax=Thioflexithrix psekupsensis TaxID=1570016 RepID=A0A251X9N3_9GAMM|nr:tRNA glutamyl-Q(34) synthetase GluQRS [Thioflexithrix psekupsensis]OUD14645.1 tRNA glutamyl-Q(34) synthetase GluQRS [Thioflexithrix psekupsensis]